MFARSYLLPAGLCFLLAISLIVLPGCAGRKKKQSKADAAPTVTAKSSEELAAERAQSDTPEVPADDQSSTDMTAAPSEAAPEAAPGDEQMPADSADSTRGRAFDEAAAPPPAQEEPPAYDNAPAPEEEPPAPVRTPRAKRRAAHAAAAEEPAGAESAAPAAGGEYVVVKGDTIAKIARTHQVTPRKLMDANHIVDPRKLKVGQKLVIP